MDADDGARSGRAGADRQRRAGGFSRWRAIFTRHRSGAGRYQALDGLRAISILIVLFGHGGYAAAAPPWLLPMRELGVLGVEIFFSISGFIITHLLLRERARQGGINLRSFWTRRALRILPPLAAVSGGIALAAAAGVMTWHLDSFIGAFTLTKDTALLGGDWFFGHTWSLALEEQFYLLWPLLLAAFADSDTLVFGLCALLLAGPLLALTPLRWPALQNILPYLPYFGSGCLLALLLHRGGERLHDRLARLRWRGPLTAAIVAAACVVAYLRQYHQALALTMPLVGLLGPLATLGLVAQAVLAQRPLVLGWAPLCWLGRVSYSVYLWQQLFLGPAHVYDEPWRWSAWPLNLFAAIACGAAGYCLIERPCARLKARLAAPRPAARVAGSAAGAAAAYSGLESPR